MKIAWSVKVPKEAKIKVKEGEGVEVGDVVYEFHKNIVERLSLVGWQSLGSTDRKNILQKIIKKEIIKNEIIGKIGWFSNIVIKSPGTGKCLGVDEFGNIELETEKDEKYLSPISAKRIRVEEDKIIFELKGSEFEGEGINQFKAWGGFCEIIINDLSQVDNSCLGKVVVIKDSLEAAIKAEAIGVVGLILVGFEKFKEFDECEIPIITMAEDEVEKMIKFGDHKQLKVWLNAAAGKALVVLE